MYGKEVEVYLPRADVRIKVFVTCTPDTPEEELQLIAMKMLHTEIANMLAMKELNR